MYEINGDLSKLIFFLSLGIVLLNLKNKRQNSYQNSYIDEILEVNFLVNLMLPFLKW